MDVANQPRPRAAQSSINYNAADYAADEMEFMLAVERFKRENRRPFPTCSEILAVIKALGYRKEPPQ